MPFFSCKVFALVLSLILGLLTLASAQTSLSTSDWETLRPEGEEFSVLMPKGSTFESGKEPYHKMELNTRFYLAKTQPGRVFAVVSLSGIKSTPAAYTEAQRLNSYVDAFKNLFSAKLRGKDAIAKLTLVGEKTLQGNVGREYHMTIGDLSGTAQVYATRKRFYAVVFLNTKKDESIQDEFLSSFMLPEKFAQTADTTAAAEQQVPARRQGVSTTRAEANAPAANREPGDAEQTGDDTAPAPGAGTNSADAGTRPTESADQQPGQKAPISGGVLNNKATSLPQPAFPPIAVQAKASGTVVVQVVIDEQGNVISAHAVSGHPLLQAAAVAAARQAKFPSTFLMGEPVKVTGVITYNFVRQ